MSIWKYSEIRKQINSEVFLSNGEGETTLEKKNHNSNIILVKREDLNPTGSWKDRASAFKISALKAQNIKEIVLTTSGNYGISMLEYAKLLPELKLHIVVSNEINLKKKESLISLIKNTEHKLYFSKTPKVKSARISAKLNIPNLKSSTDNESIKGYWSLGFELAFLQKKYRDKEIYLFTTCSSGNAVIGIAQGIQIKTEDECNIPKFMIGQTSSTHPLVEDELNTEKSLADAIVDKSMLRIYQIKKLVSTSNGTTFIVNNSELENALKFSEELGFKDLSYNSLLSFAGYLKFQEKIKNSVCILIASGR